MAVAVRTSGEACAAGSFCVPSASVPGHCWTVIWIGGGTQHCFCPRFAIKGQCRHVEAVALAVEIEVRDAMARSTPESRAAAARRLAQLEEEFSR